MDPSHIDAVPLEFQPYYEQLASTLQPYIEITAKPGKTEFTQSKILGLPYLPQGQNYPKDLDGSLMLLLAQLNFAEIPPLPDYPHQGIVQFFISPWDQAFGANLDSFDTMQQQTRFHVRYYESIVPENEWIQDFEFLRQGFADQALLSPAEQECKLTFDAKAGVIPLEDYRFEQTIGDRFFERFGSRQDEVRDIYWQTFSAQGHRIGGYSFFPQADPRSAAPQDDWVLLLQIDSDVQAGILWGDVGVGNFFIPRNNLRHRDFSKILYTWDCS